MPKEMLATLLLDPSAWFYSDWGQRCQRVWEHQPGYMAWYARVSHPRIITPDEGSPPRLANREQLIEEEHAKQLPNTLTIIRDVLQMADNVVAMSAEMTKEELVQEMIRIGSTGRPALTYQISRQHRGMMGRIIMTLFVPCDISMTFTYVPLILFLAFYFYHFKIILYLLYVLELMNVKLDEND